MPEKILSDAQISENNTHPNFGQRTNHKPPLPRSIHSQALSVEELFHLGHFHPAKVQRNFKWQVKQAEQLLSDLMLTEQILFRQQNPEINNTQQNQVNTDETEENNIATGTPEGITTETIAPPEILTDYFLGSLILKPEENDIFRIYDGLQRLTTLTILIAILRDFITNPELKARLHLLIENEDKGYRLHHSLVDLFLRDKTQKLGEAKKNRYSEPAWRSGQNIFNISENFRLVLRKDYKKKDKQELLERIAHYILDRAIFTVTMMQQDRGARQAFITTNMFGLRLTREENFKGQLLALAKNEEDLQTLKTRWDQIRSTVEGDRDQFESFLKAIDMIERRTAQSNDYLEDLANHLETKANKNYNSLLSWIDAVNLYANAWKQLQSFMWERSLDEVGLQIRKLSHLRWDDWIPLALYFMERYQFFQADKKNFIGQRKREAEFKKTVERFELLQQRCMAITLYGFSPTQKQEIFTKAMVMVRQKKPAAPFNSKTSRYPYAQKPLNLSITVCKRVKEGLKLPLEDSEARRTLILWYEETLWHPEIARFKTGGDHGATVEHLLPRKPNKKGQWIKDFPDAKTRFDCMTSLGNLCLADRDVNKDHLKIHEYKNKHLILKEFKQFSKYKITANLEDTLQWTEEKIQERTNEMADDIWQHLGLPEDPKPKKS